MSPSVIIASLLVASSTILTAQAAALGGVLARVDAYLTAYEMTAATLVADERYEQVLELDGASLTRVLRSEYALARAPGGEAWTGYRDTYEVDGRPVRDRRDRLLSLLSDGRLDSAAQAFRITRENARFNLGEEIVARTINVPTVALDLIHPRHRGRMRFTRRGDDIAGGVPVWVLGFEEHGRGTILRTPNRRDRRARGGVWADPESGAVWRTDLSWEGEPRGFISVRYRRDANLGALVPDTMIEEYRGRTGIISGRAVYSNYRRFQTSARVLAPE